MPFLYTGAQFPYFRRCIKPGLMIPSKSRTVSGFWTVKMYILHFKVIQLKAVCSALKSLQDKLSTKELVQLFIKFVNHCVRLSEQTGGERIPPSLAQLGLLQSLKYTHNRHILGCLKVILNISPAGIKVWRILAYYNP